MTKPLDIPVKSEIWLIQPPPPIREKGKINLRSLDVKVNVILKHLIFNVKKKINQIISIAS